MMPAFTLPTWGICRPGRNLHFVLLRDLLSQKPIKTLVLDVRKDEDRYSHPVFPNLAKSKDVIAPVLLFNRDIFSDLFAALITRFECHKRTVLGMNPANYVVEDTPYGYGAGTRVAPKEEMETMLERRIKAENNLTALERDFYMRYPRTYIKKIATLCKEKNVELVFLYLKSYGVKEVKPLEMDFYQKFGEVWIPPVEVFEKPENWMDPDHLNINGATELAEWLAFKINSL